MPDKKFAVMTDSACDMPFTLADECGVDILSFEITLDGRGYTERVDFDFDQYYDMLRNSTGFPSTAHVTMPRFIAKYKEYEAAGVEDLLYISINSTGSATYDAATMARKDFYEENPKSPLRIHIIDSHCYSMGYGWYVAQAAKKLDAGEDVQSVITWMNEKFSRMEIILAAYSLKFIKRSGRISAAAAFAGELLGLKPIISLIDGESVVRKKVRSDKDVLPALMDYATQHHEGEWEYGVGGTHQNLIDELAAQCTQAFGTPPVYTFKLGAAVATNTGPDAIAITYLGPVRPR